MNDSIDITICVYMIYNICYYTYTLHIYIYMYKISIRVL